MSACRDADLQRRRRLLRQSPLNFAWLLSHWSRGVLRRSRRVPTFARIWYVNGSFCAVIWFQPLPEVTSNAPM